MKELGYYISTTLKKPKNEESLNLERHTLTTGEKTKIPVTDASLLPEKNLTEIKKKIRKGDYEGITVVDEDNVIKWSFSNQEHNEQVLKYQQEKKRRWDQFRLDLEEEYLSPEISEKLSEKGKEYIFNYLRERTEPYDLELEYKLYLEHLEQILS